MTDFRALCAELLEALENAIRIIYNEDGTKHISTADPVIAKADAALAQPEPQGPTDEELRDLWSWAAGQDQGPWPTQQHCFARAVLCRWGRPAIEPVLVAERLPGPEDCAPWPDEPDANPWCWAGKEVDGGWEWDQIGMLGVDAKNLGRVLGGAGYTHWLPHHALPMPQQEADRGWIARTGPTGVEEKQLWMDCKGVVRERRDSKWVEVPQQDADRG